MTFTNLQTFDVPISQLVQPLSKRITIVTPVYNGACHLEDCIKSVIGQTYTDWEYVIVDNCSVDETGAIARRYAAQDGRVRLVTNTKHVSVMENFNLAVRMVTPSAAYCKIVAADDWLYPECLSEMIGVAERYPSVGIVGSYSTSGTELRWFGVPSMANRIDGRDMCRRYLRGLYTFNAPTALLYRASIIRDTDQFFAGLRPNADTDACIRVLHHCDFGFVHKILSFERVHDRSITSGLSDMNAFLLDRIQFVVTYGEELLGSFEQKSRLDTLLNDYYKYLAHAAVHRRNTIFWEYHRHRMIEIGLPLSRTRLAKCTAVKILELIFNIERSARSIGRAVTRRLTESQSVDRHTLLVASRADDPAEIDRQATKHATVGRQ